LQEKALSSLDKAMDTVYATASSWKLAMQDLDQQLQQMLGHQKLSEKPPQQLLNKNDIE